MRNKAAEATQDVLDALLVSITHNARRIVHLGKPLEAIRGLLSELDDTLSSMIDDIANEAENFEVPTNLSGNWPS